MRNIFSCSVVDVVVATKKVARKREKPVLPPLTCFDTWPQNPQELQAVVLVGVFVSVDVVIVFSDCVIIVFAFVVIIVVIVVVIVVFAFVVIVVVASCLPGTH